MKRILNLLLLFIFISAKSQVEITPLEKTRAIADKIIRETSFEYTLEPMGFNGGWSQFRTGDIREGEQFVAYARIYSEGDHASLLGFSFEGNISVYLNGSEIFSGESKTLELSEYTYNRYNVQEKIYIPLNSGENDVLVKCLKAESRTLFMMMPMNELDARDPLVSIVPHFEDVESSEWLISGPHPAEKSSQEIFEQLSSKDQNFCVNGSARGWELPPRPILRKLVIEPSNSYIRDSYADWNYANGGTMLGVLYLNQLTGDEKYLDFVKTFAENIVQNQLYFQLQYQNIHAIRGSFYRLFRMTMLDDSGGPVLPFAELTRILGGHDYDYILSEVLDYVVNKQSRLPDKTLSRPEPEPNTLWGDDLFMSVPFLCRMAEVNKDPGLYDEAARQIIQFNNYLLNKETGLYYHGYYADRNTPTGIHWGRVNGWVTWAMTEALMLIPEDHPDYKKVLKIYRKHIESIARYQDKSGMWHQVLTHPETYEETSCTAMFTLALARGVTNGWLNEKYRNNALKGWTALEGKIESDGTVTGICRGTGIGESIEFYQKRATFEHDPRGLGAMLTAGTEIQRLLER